jgi:hypothetical protein
MGSVYLSDGQIQIHQVSHPACYTSQLLANWNILRARHNLDRLEDWIL